MLSIEQAWEINPDASKWIRVIKCDDTWDVMDFSDGSVGTVETFPLGDLNTAIKCAWVTASNCGWHYDGNYSWGTDQ